MISKIKKPVSILLALMMVVSLFTIVPMTVSAATGDYYLVGTFNNWDQTDTTYKLDKNPENDAEYMLLNLTVDANTELKVKSTKGEWYPSDQNFTWRCVC